MKKIMYFILIIFVLSYCSPKQEKVERYMEHGVEVIVNHLEPYKIKGEPSTLYLEEEFTIDIERDEIAEIGLIDIKSFVVDSKANLYLIQSPKSNDNFVYKFNKDGTFVNSFGKRGQGPSELQWIGYLSINSQDEIAIADSRNKKFLVFSKDGRLIKETRIDSNIHGIIPLENGKYLIWRQLGTPHDEYHPQNYLGLYNSEFEEIKELDRLNVPNASAGKRQKVTRYAFEWTVSNRNIYAGNSERDYEIWVYDLKGNLKRKIKKKYKHIEISQELKKIYSKPFRRSLFKNYYFPKHMPPFQFLFTDNEGRLFVMTYEKAKNPREYMYDIFNPDGIFIGRMSLGNITASGAPDWTLDARTKNNRLYCLREKDSGYKELVVYRMRWE